MPTALHTAIHFVAAHRTLFIAGGVAFVLLLTAILTLIIALRKTKRSRGINQGEKPEIAATPAADAAPQGEPKVAHARLTIGDVASPWTQSVYERHSPEKKIDLLLPAFGFDSEGNIHRAQNAELVRGEDIESVVRRSDTAAGVAVNGMYAALLLWHADNPLWAQMALKVASHAHIAPEQKELVRFLFQDVIGVRVKPAHVPGLTRWENRAFRAAVLLHVAPRLTTVTWDAIERLMPDTIKEYAELEAAQKLPVRLIYRRAAASAIFTEGLYKLNLATLKTFMSARRFNRIKSAGHAARLEAWLHDQPISSEREALLQIANPEIFDREDFSAERAAAILHAIDIDKQRAWLFEHKEQPLLALRLQYFKFFCLFEFYGEAVRCFATLGVFRRDRALRLFYARALFSSGMQHEAWAEVSALLAQFPNDAAVLNEAGIYAHKLGRHEEAAEIFARARVLYPDDATLAYNEAVFTEEYSKAQVEEKWSRVQKMVDPPVIG